LDYGSNTVFIHRGIAYFVNESMVLLLKSESDQSYFMAHGSEVTIYKRRIPSDVAWHVLSSMLSWQNKILMKSCSCRGTFGAVFHHLVTRVTHYTVGTNSFSVILRRLQTEYRYWSICI